MRSPFPCGLNSSLTNFHQLYETLCYFIGWLLTSKQIFMTATLLCGHQWMVREGSQLRLRLWPSEQSRPKQGRTWVGTNSEIVRSSVIIMISFSPQNHILLPVSSQIMNTQIIKLLLVWLIYLFFEYIILLYSIFLLYLSLIEHLPYFSDYRTHQTVRHT